MTDEASFIFKISGVDPKSLIPRTLESFIKTGVTKKQAETLAAEHEQQRHDLIQLIMNGMTSVQSKLSTILNNLSCPNEERLLRTTYRRNLQHLESMPSNVQSSRLNRN